MLFVFAGCLNSALLLLPQMTNYRSIAVLLAVVLSGCEAKRIEPSDNSIELAIKFHERISELEAENRRLSDFRNKICVEFEGDKAISVSPITPGTEQQLISVLRHAIHMLETPMLGEPPPHPNEHSVLKKPEQPVGKEKKPCCG